MGSNFLTSEFVTIMKIPALFILAFAISITNTSLCTKPDENKARVWKAQAKNVKKVIDNLEKGVKNKDVFTGFGNVLEKLTKNGVQCSQETKDAFKLLTDCPATAKASCEKDGLDLASLKSKAASCESTLTCNNLPDDCNLKSTLEELKKLRDEKCMNNDLAGSFKACMNIVKGNLDSLISPCVDVYCPGTCSGR